MDVFNKLLKLDTFTRKQIINEFEGTLYIKHKIDTTPIDHFPSRQFSINQLYGAFLLVIAIIFVIGSIL